MPISLHLLILEDEPLDVELIIAALEDAGYSPQWERVETREAFLERLDKSTYDLILADYQLPTFDGFTALKLFNQRNLNIPFIIVSGTLGEEVAIESLKAGATDYVLKQRLERLGPVVQRALREKEEQRLRRQAEDELRKLSQAVKQSPTSIIITDTNGNIEYVNPKFTEITGYTFDETIGQNPRILKGGYTSAEEYEHLWQRISTGQEWRGEFYNKRKDGTFFWEMASITAIKNADGNITHFLAVKEDITERKRIEEQARKQERLASVGQLAAGIAHDFNNILAVISLYSDLLAGEVLSSAGKKQVQIISQQSKRAADLIQQILDFSRRAILERAPIELSYQIKELVKLWERTLPDNLNLVFKYGSDTYSVYADPTRIQQMLMNLVINARDAMPDGGTLTICLKRRRIAERSDMSSWQIPPGDWVQITIADSGVGIASDILPHLYEPFFTTKGPGTGTGLGLAQVYGIVKQHEGHITVETVVGKGTTFTVCLPAVSESEPMDEGEETAVITSGNGEFILIVEDNDITRKALADSLQTLNYQVLVAKNGLEALTVLAERGDDIALILCDQTMPKMSGEELLYTLKSRGETIPFVLISAYVRKDDMERLQDLGMIDWLHKPLRLEELSDIIARTVRRYGRYNSPSHGLG
ncbi:MAG: response regulator [Anaerolineales bacterium]|nr:response regulator [Anaerolineales bacterium]